MPEEQHQTSAENWKGQWKVMVPNQDGGVTSFIVDTEEEANRIAGDSRHTQIIPLTPENQQSAQREREELQRGWAVNNTRMFPGQKSFWEKLKGLFQK